MAFRPSFEPLVDRFANASAILWTMLFWTSVFCAALTLLGLAIERSVYTRINGVVCRVCCFLISGYFLRFWLQGWWPQASELDHRPWLLMLLIGILYVAVRRRRLLAPMPRASSVPSWQDCYSLAILPLLLVTAVIMGYKITGQFIGNFLTQASSSSAGRRLTSAASPNVVVIVADTMRAQSLSLYGYSKKTTPFLERLGESSIVYLEAHSNSTTTQISLSAILSGQHPLTRGRPTPDVRSPYDQKNLLHVLRAHGYTTAAVTSNVDASFRLVGLTPDLTEAEETAFAFLTLSWARKLGVHPTELGEQMYADLSLIFPFIGFPRHTSYYGESEESLKIAKQKIGQLRQPFFLFIHLHQPHEPYTSPFVTSYQRFVSQFRGMETGQLKLYAPYPPESQPLVDQYKVEYEASIRRVDAALAEFLKWLEAQSWFSKSLLIVTGDHGESFERGYLNHGEELYESSTHVPLLIRYPGQQDGKRQPGLVQSLDIAPTILRTAELPVPSWMEGQPLLPGSAPAERAVVAVNYKRPSVDVNYPLPTKLALWWRQYKLIAACDSGQFVVYDLASDPQEQVDIGKQNPALTLELKRRMQEQLAKQPHKVRLNCQTL